MREISTATCSIFIGITSEVWDGARHARFKTQNDAAPTNRAASFVIPLSPTEDSSEDMLQASSRDCADAWSGIEPPDDDDAEAIEPEREIDPMAFDTSPPAPMQKPEPVARIPVTADVDEIEEQDDLTPERGGWVISLVCIGVAIIAACLLLPLAEENHQLAWQREKLKTDLTQIQQQVKVNEEFLGKIENDPTLAERLAQRQMKLIRKGSKILELPENGREETSPFQLVSLPPPIAAPAYRPLGGALSAIVRNPRSRLYLTGFGLMLVACGLVLGGDSKRADV